MIGRSIPVGVSRSHADARRRMRTCRRPGVRRRRRGLEGADVAPARHPPAGRRRAAGSFPRRRSPRFPQAAPVSAPDPRCPAAAPAAGPLPRGRLRPAGRSWRRRPGCGPELWRDRSAAVRTVGGRPAGHQRLLQLERPEGVDEPCPSASPSGCVATCRTGSRILASRSPRSARWRNASHRRSCPAPASPECREALPSLRRGPADAAGGSGPAVRRRRAADANLRADAARGQGARRRLTRLPRSCRGRRRWPKQVSRLAVLALLANVALAVAACGKSSVRDPVHRSCLSCGGERVRH